MNTAGTGHEPMPLAGLLRIYWLEARVEFLRVLRTPGFVIPTLLFPVMFFTFFGILFARGDHGAQHSLYSLAGLGCFGIISPALFGFGVGFALDRGLGWLQVKRASPMPPAAYLVAKLCMSMLFALIIVALLFALAAGLTPVHLTVAQWTLLAITLVAGTIPFCAMGLAIGAWSKPQSAPAVVNLIFLPMSFLSGLWFPLSFMPPALQAVATFLPAYHLGEAAFAASGVKPGAPVALHWVILAAFTLGFLALAARGYRRHQALGS